MDKLYYQPSHLWKGQKAIRKLKELSKAKPEVVKQWLSKQAFWQVYLPLGISTSTFCPESMSLPDIKLQDL